MVSQTHVLGVLGGSSLFHATKVCSVLVEKVVDTEHGSVVCHVGTWPSRSEHDIPLQLVFVQRHHADPDGKYRQPRQINYRAIALALKSLGCDAAVGVYSVGSMMPSIGVGRFVVPEDYFNPFHIMHLSHDYDAHVVPELHGKLKDMLAQALSTGGFEPHVGGVYVQTAGPRFETKSEVRFFAQLGHFIGMTGANEAELLNELRMPCAMFSIVDNMANGLGDPLTLEAFKKTQKANADLMERAFLHVLDELASSNLLSSLASTD